VSWNLLVIFAEFAGKGKFIFIWEIFNEKFNLNYFKDTNREEFPWTALLEYKTGKFTKYSKI
jgi:hypothetical protein